MSSAASAIAAITNPMGFIKNNRPTEANVDQRKRTAVDSVDKGDVAEPITAEPSELKVLPNKPFLMAKLPTDNPKRDKINFVISMGPNMLISIKAKPPKTVVSAASPVPSITIPLLTAG